jgi:hypothetical protein
MLDPELKAEFEALNVKIDAAYKAADATRKWIKWTIIVTTVLFILPLLALPFAVGSLLSSYSAALNF